jgi:sugar lactone lactonase YvrE
MHRRHTSLFGYVSIVLAAVVSCSQPPLPGSLAVTVTGLPPGVAARIEVGGPGDFAAELTGDAILEDLAPGRYDLMAAPVLGHQEVVPSIYDPAPASRQIDVLAGERASAVFDHGARPGSGRLWHGTAGTSILRGFAGPQLVADGTPEPVAVLEGADVTVRGIAFDGNGNVWVTQTDGVLRRFGAADLIAGGTVLPDRVIARDETGLNDPRDLAFDDAGRLWVIDHAGGRLEAFDAARLATGGPWSPAIVIGSDGTSLDLPSGLAFDDSGDLYVACTHSGRVERFASADLETSGNPSPAVALDLSGFAIGLAFDARGALWVAEAASDTVQRFGPTALTGTDPPTPEATVDLQALGIDLTDTSLAIDHEGALWVTLGAVGWLLRYDTPSGTIQSPVAQITTDVMNGGALAFWPIPPRLPIRAP